MSARKDRYVRIVVLLALALGLWRVVRTRQVAIAHAHQAVVVSSQSALDRTSALYRALYPEAATMQVEFTGRADGQWLLECRDSASTAPTHFIWDVATGELVSCGGLRLPRSDRAAWTADHAIADPALRTERMARRWLTHLGFADEGSKGSSFHVGGPFRQSQERFVSCQVATQTILLGVDTVSGELKSFYRRPLARGVTVRLH